MTITTQEFKLRGETVVGKLKELLHEGNIRRITLRNEEGHTLIEIPLDPGGGGGAADTGLGRCERDCCAGGEPDHRGRANIRTSARETGLARCGRAYF